MPFLLSNQVIVDIIISILYIVYTHNYPAFDKIINGFLKTPLQYTKYIIIINFKK